MANVILPADLPTNWQGGQIVAPNGPDAGLPEQYGYFSDKYPDWLESRAAEPGLRGIAARLPRSVQRRLFHAASPLAQRYAPDGVLEENYVSDGAEGWALAPSGNRLYLPGAGEGMTYFRF